MGYKKNTKGSYILGSDGNEFTVTKKEREELQVLVKRANQRRVDKAHKYYDTMSTANVMVGIEYDEYMKLLNKKGFITEKYTTRLDQFKSKNDVKSLLKELKKVTQKGYGNNRVDDIRYKMIEQIEKNYRGLGGELIEKITNMADSELLSLYLQADREIIRDLYGSPTDEEIQDIVEEASTYIDKLIGGSTANNLDGKKFKQGFKNYKQRQTYKRKKRESKQRAKAGYKNN